MKIISKEEEEAHYKAVVKGGLTGGAIGLTVALASVIGASRRYAGFRSLTIPFRSFLVTSGGTFAAIIVAERSSINFAKQRDPMNFYKDESSRTLEAIKQREATPFTKVMDWGKENRYTIVFSSWIASMALALVIVGRNRYLNGAQKLVQARMYAQGLTLAVLIATAALEVGDAKKGTGRWETVMVVDPDDPEHKHLIEKKVHKEDYAGQDLWMDMVAAEERRLNAQKEAKAAAAAKVAAVAPKASSPAQ